MSSKLNDGEAATVVMEISVLESFRDHVEAINRTIQHLCAQTTGMSATIRGLERKLNVVRVPFEASLYEYLESHPEQAQQLSKTVLQLKSKPRHTSYTNSPSFTSDY